MVNTVEHDNDPDQAARGQLLQASCCHHRAQRELAQSDECFARLDLQGLASSLQPLRGTFPRTPEIRRTDDGRVGGPLRQQKQGPFHRERLQEADSRRQVSLEPHAAISAADNWEALIRRRCRSKRPFSCTANRGLGAPAASLLHLGEGKEAAVRVMRQAAVPP